MYVSNNTLKIKMRNLYIDGSNLLHRAHWVSKSTKTSPIHIFLSSIRKYVNQFHTTELYLLWDGRRDVETINHRHELLGSEYKGNRDKEKSAEVFRNVPYIDDITSCLGIRNLYPNILEADDIIAWLCTKKFPTSHGVVVSTDKDLLQLVSQYIEVYNPIKDQIISTDNFKHIVGVDIDMFIAYKSILGDKSDNIDGIPTVGPKRALAMLESFPESIPEGYQELYERNVKLMDLDYSLSINESEQTYLQSHLSDIESRSEIDISKFEKRCKYFNLVTVINNIHDWKSMFDREKQSKHLCNLISSMDFSAGFD